MAEATAGTEGPDWSARAPVWVELWAHLSDPARAAVADATGIGSGGREPRTRVLDVGCGSGEFCALAAARGATHDGAAGGARGHARVLRPAHRRGPGSEDFSWTAAVLTDILRA